MIVMACKTSGDSSRRVPGIILRVIQVSFTTQGLLSKASARDSPATAGRLARVGRVALFFEAALTSLEFGEARLTALRFDEAPK